jgi:hypothetical protein
MMGFVVEIVDVSLETELFFDLEPLVTLFFLETAEAEDFDGAGRLSLPPPRPDGEEAFFFGLSAVIWWWCL